MFEVGDLVYIRYQDINLNMWWSQRDVAYIITEINKLTKAITLNNGSGEVKVLPRWIEKRTMEETCTK